MASVIKGPVNQLMRTMSVTEAPQIHLHFLVDEEDGLGFEKVELCCHGCSTGIILTFTEDLEAARFREQFEQHHKTCPNRAYQMRCPDIRLRTAAVDLRRTVKPRRRRTPATLSTRTE